MRLKPRLTLAFMLLALLPLVTAGLVLTRAGYQAAYDMKLAEQRQTASLAAVEIEGQVAALVRELLLTVRIREPAGLDPARQRATLSDLLGWDNQFTDLIWLDGQGNQSARVSLNQVYAGDHLAAPDKMFPEGHTRLDGEPEYGPIGIDPDTAEPLMVVSVHQIDARHGTVLGTLVARLRLKRMWEVVARNRAANLDHLLYITDLEGLVLAHPDPSVVIRGPRIPPPEDDGLATSTDGRRVLVARTTITLGPRRLLAVVEQPLGKALALPVGAAMATLTIIAGALAVALALALSIGRSIVHPLHRLVEVAGLIAGGDLSRRAAGESRTDEIGDLARAFNAMTTRLAESVATLEARVDDRTRDLTTVQSRLSEAIESISEGFVLCDREDRVVLTNRRFRDFFPEIAHLARPGTPFREVIAAAGRLGLACDAADSDGWIAKRQALRAAEASHVQHLKSGRWLLVNERHTASGQMVALYTDITDLKAGEEALRLAKAQAESAAQAKSEFLATMSHELRTPLNAIIGFSDTMRAGLFGELGNPRYTEYANDIHNSGQHLLSLINDILDLSKIEAGAMTVDRRPVTLAPVIDRALTMTRDAADAANLTVDRLLPADLPPVAGDERRLLQVMLNLLSNAVKFTPDGGRITIAAATDGDEVVVQVADTGIGIAARDIPLAMEAFGQIDSSRSRRFPGSGLGLPLSRKLIELHGGSLSITSTVNSGTTVTVRLPRAAEPTTSG